MKKLLATLCVVSLCMGLFAATVSAFTFTELKPEEVFTPELIEMEKVSDGLNLVPNTADLGKFTDKDQVSSWALEGVGALAANGIMSGTSATTLSPKASCPIEQSIVLIYRLYKKTN